TLFPYKGRIDLVLTDFVMPRLGGLDLAHRLREVRPDAKILFMSGYTDGQLDQDKVAGLGGIELIEKPFRAMQLLERVRKLLEPDQ
ncbi:MAG: response regulator, partial [Planctomycetales bacterium]|nr:response regulator [Planctomycetales bacterium]